MCIIGQWGGGGKKIERERGGPALPSKPWQLRSTPRFASCPGLPYPTLPFPILPWLLPCQCLASASASPATNSLRIYSLGSPVSICFLSLPTPNFFDDTYKESLSQLPPPTSQPIFPTRLLSPSTSTVETQPTQDNTTRYQYQ